MKAYRHGDVIIKEVCGLPNEVKKLDHKVLAEGEVTGHAHRIDHGALFEFDEKKYLEITDELATLTHEEHKALELPRGIYEITIQREYDDESEWRQVRD